MKRLLALLVIAFLVLNNVRVEVVQGDAQGVEPADLILLNGKVVTVDANFGVVQAVAVRGEKIVAVGSDQEVLKFKGPNTKTLDAGGKTVLPGLYDSHVHPTGAATSELVEALPELRSLEDVFAYIRKKSKETPEGDWIVLRYAFPTRLKEARFPSRA